MNTRGRGRRQGWPIGVLAFLLAAPLFLILPSPNPVVEAPRVSPVVILDAGSVDLAMMAAAGGRVVTDYGNGKLLVRWPVDWSLPRDGVDPQTDRTKISLYYSGIVFDTTNGEPAFPPFLRGSSDEHLLQFLGPIRSEWIDDLRGGGLEFDQYLANYAFVVRGSRAAIDSATLKPYVSWTGPYHPGYKLAPALLEQGGEVSVFVVGFQSASLDRLAARVEALGGRVEAMWSLPPTVTATIAADLLPELARESSVLAIEERSMAIPLDRVTGEIHGYHASWNPARSGLPSSLTGRSPGPDGIMYDGDDYFEAVGIQDTGFDEGDANDGPLDFFDSPNGDRVIRYFRHTGPLRDGKCGRGHGTHVAGIVAGDGYASERDGFEDQGDQAANWSDKDWRRSEAGVAPEALVSLDGTQSGNDFFCVSGLVINLAYWDCQYLNGFISVPLTSGVSSAVCGSPWLDGSSVAMHNAGIEGGSRAYVAVHSNSWGSGGSNYGPTASGADARMNTAPERFIVFAAGNAGPGPNTMIPEALLKNGISVGAAESLRPEWFEADDPDVLGSFSSRGGPGQSNGRLKPDLVAVGSTVLSLNTLETFSEWGKRFSARFAGLPPGGDGRFDLDKYCPPTYCFAGDGVPDYRYYEGTSFATPHAAGSAMLVREYLREVVARNNASSPYFNPPSYLVKAFLINGAARMDPDLYEYPGYDQGWGRIDLERSLFPPPPRTNQFEIGQLTTTGTWSPTGIVTNVLSSDVPLKVTLVWLDAPGAALIRDLDLIVRSPSNLTYRGNQYTAGWTNPSSAASDRWNNTEQVEVERPEPGTWQVEVRGFSVPSTAKFALIFSADVGPRSPFDVDLSVARPVVRVSPNGTAIVPITARNYGTGIDDLTLRADVSGAPGVNVSFFPSSNLAMRSDESQVVVAAVTADPSASEGTHEVELHLVSTHDPGPIPAEDAVSIRVEVLRGMLPLSVAVANGSTDERDPSILAFQDGPIARLFVAYRKTEPVSADRLTGGRTVWVGRTTLGVDGMPDAPFVHERVIGSNDDPGDLRLLRMTSGAYSGRIVLTWSGRDPSDGKPWSRVGVLDPPYLGAWSVTTIQKNEGTTGRSCNLARANVPLFRASGVGQLLFIWEAIEGDCVFAPDFVNVYAKVSSDGGISWGPLEVVFAGGPATQFIAPAGVVDQNDVAWVVAAGAFVPGSRSDLVVRLFDDAGWSPAPTTIRILDSADDLGWPAVFSTDEGSAGNRVYVAATRDSLRAELRAYLTFADGAFTSVTPPNSTDDPARPGVPCGVGCLLSADFSSPSGSGLAGPFGSSLALGSFDRGPVLQLGGTTNGPVQTAWLLGRDKSPFSSTDLRARFSSDGFVTSVTTALSADGFPKGHPSLFAFAVAGGVERMYVVYHASRGVVTDHDYDVYLSAVHESWPSDPDGLGPLPVSVVGTPNPVSSTSSFRLLAGFDDTGRGGNNIAGAEFSPNGSAGPWSPMTPMGPFDSPTEAAFADLDVTLLGWGVGTCHEVLARALDAAGNWGPTGSIEECVTAAPPPVPPIVTSTTLGGSAFENVSIAWGSSPDEGDLFGTTLYRVDRSTWPSGTFAQVAEVPATGAGVYNWTDVGAGHGDSNVYLYRISSVNRLAVASANLTLGAKYSRAIGEAGWNLISVPNLPADRSLTSILQTLDWTMVRTFVAADPAHPWRVHTVGGPSNLETLDPSQGAWVYVRTPGAFTVAGLLLPDMVVELSPGWNLVSFRSLGQATYTAGDLRAAVPVTFVEGYDSAGPYNLRKLSDSDVLSPGFGYWVYAMQAATWKAR